MRHLTSFYSFFLLFLPETSPQNERIDGPSFQNYFKIGRREGGGIFEEGGSNRENESVRDFGTPSLHDVRDFLRQDSTDIPYRRDMPRGKNRLNVYELLGRRTYSIGVQ